MEQTLVILKNDAVKRKLTGEIIARFEKAGFNIVTMKMFTPSRSLINKHYPNTKDWLTKVGEKTLKTYVEYNMNPIKEIGTDDPLKIGKTVKKWLIDYLSSGLVIAMILEGNHAIDVVRKICGYTSPHSANPGTIRGDFSIDSPALANSEKRAVENLVHASENKKEAEREIKLWF